MLIPGPGYEKGEIKSFFIISYYSLKLGDKLAQVLNNQNRYCSGWDVEVAGKNASGLGWWIGLTQKNLLDLIGEIPRTGSGDEIPLSGCWPG